MANKGVSEKMQDICENLTALQKQLDKLVEVLLENKFEEKLEEKLSDLEENQKLLDEKICLKIDDLIDLLKLLPIRDKCLTLEELQTFVKKEGGDMVEISEKIEKSEKEINFFAPLP
jgi:DNA-binding FrmR family transcriptional regulator